MAGYELEIDSKPTEQGAKRIVKSFDDIRAAAEKMERGSVSSFNAMERAFQSLSGKRLFLGPTLDSLNQLQKVMQGFRSIGTPNSAALDKFFSAVSKARGPSRSSIDNINRLMSVIARYQSVSAPSAKIIPFLSALSTFKGPNPTAGRNTAALLKALSNFQPSGNLSQTIKDFQRLTRSVKEAADAMGRLQSNSRNIRSPNFNGGGGGGGGYRGMLRELGLLETALLKTGTAVNALGGIFGLKFLADASNNVIKVRAQLEAATGSVQQANIQFAFLRQQTQDLGLDFVATSRSYALLLGSLKGTGVTFEEAMQIFKGFSTAGRALQLSSADLEGVFRALGQIMSKGKLQAEELRGQLGDRLPGAFMRFARALNMTGPGELDSALKKGAISGQVLKKAILDVSTTLEIEFQEAAKKSAQTVDAAFNRLKNTFTFTAADFGQNGFNYFLIQIAGSLERLLQSSALNSFLRTLGGFLKYAADNTNLFATAIIFLANRALVGAIGSLAAYNGLTQAVIVNNVKAAWSFGVKAVSATRAAVATNGLSLAAWKTTIATNALSLASVKAAFSMNNLKAAAVTAGKFLLTNWVNIAALAITGFVVFLDNAYEKTLALNGELNKQKDVAPDLQNALKTYSEELVTNTDLVDKNTKALKENIKTKILDLQKNYEKSSAPDVRMEQGRLIGKSSFWSGGEIMGSDAKVAKTLGYEGERGTFRTYAVRSAQGYENLFKRLAAAKSYLEQAPNASDQLKSLVARVEGYLATFDSLDAAGAAPFDVKALKTKLAGKNYNKSNVEAVISGELPDVVSPGTKNFLADADRLSFQMEKPGLKAAANREAALSVLRGQKTPVALGAATAAEQRLASFEQGFEPTKRASGIMAEAKANGLLANSYEQAKKSLVDFYAAEQEALDRSENDKDVARTVSELRVENEIRRKNLTVYQQGKAAVEEMNIALEVQSRLMGTSAEGYEERKSALEEQLRAQLEINRAISVQERIGNASREIQANTELAAGMAGKTPLEVERLKEMIALKQQLEQEYGQNSAAVDFFLRIKKASDEQAEAVRRMTEDFEAIRQLSVDVADTIVNAFLTASQEGRGLGRTLKDIFGSIKRQILETFVGRPLRQMIGDWLSTSLSPSLMGGEKQVSKVANLGSIATSLTSLGAANSTPIPAGALGGKSPASAASDLLRSLSKFSGAVSTGTQEAILSTGPKMSQWNGQAVVAEQKKSSLSMFGRLFDSKGTGESLKQGFEGLKKAFGDSNLGLGKRLGKLGEGLGKFAGVAGKAFAAFSAGSELANFLGLGKAGENILGGATAGAAIGGPVGAAVGMTIGLIKTLFAKTPSAQTSVFVGEGGFAAPGASSRYGRGDTKQSMALAAEGSNIFNRLAIQLGGSLSAGALGAFGVRKDKPFYSVTGQVRKGRPQGIEGVDYIFGTPSETSAFAIKKAASNNRFVGLDPVYDQILKTTTASTIEGLNEDLTTGQEYINFIEQSKGLVDAAKQVADIQKKFQQLSSQARILGLEEDKLRVARDRMLKTLRTDFDNEIQNQIDELQDPLKAAFDKLVKDYTDAVKTADAVGGDLTNVEKLYGLKRAEIIADYNEKMNSGIKNSAAELIKGLTAGTSSVFSPYTGFVNAKANYDKVVSELRSGNTTNLGQITNLASEAIDSARNVYGSSTDFFAIFDEIMGLLKEVEKGSFGVIGKTTPENLPELPSVTAILDQIKAANSELTDVTKAVGAEIAEGNQIMSEGFGNLASLLSGMSGGGFLATTARDIAMNFGSAGMKIPAVIVPGTELL